MKLLAEKLYYFVKDTDYYNFIDNNDIVQDDECMIEELANRLNDTSYRNGVINYLNDYLYDNLYKQEALQLIKELYDMENELEKE